jgi:hypothetical protein
MLGASALRPGVSTSVSEPESALMMLLLALVVLPWIAALLGPLVGIAVALVRNGWTVVDMKRDWAVVFPFQSE